MKKDFCKLKNNSFSGKTIKKKINARLVDNAKNIRHIKISFRDEKEAKILFQKLPFYNIPIEKPYIKCPLTLTIH